jgi:hypothetical protein
VIWRISLRHVRQWAIVIYQNAAVWSQLTHFAKKSTENRTSNQAQHRETPYSVDKPLPFSIIDNVFIVIILAFQQENTLLYRTPLLTARVLFANR